MYSRKIWLIALLAIAMVSLNACTSVSRGLGQITANKYAEPRSGTVWVVPPPQLDPPSADDRTVYISFRNISDAQSVQLTDELRKSAQEQGWTLVNDPQKAKYRLRSTLRFFGEVEPESGGAGVARSMGAVAGAATGIATGVAVANMTDSFGAGAAAGVGLGGLAAMGIANASKPREWAMIIDFVLEEYHDTPVEFTMSRNTGSGSADVAGTGNSRMASGGGTRAGNTSGATITKKSNYFPHGVRLSAWANQMNMSREEAMPHIKKRVETVVTQLLPM